MNRYEINTLASLLNDSLSRDPDLHRHPRTPVRRPGKVRRAISRVRRQD